MNKNSSKITAEDYLQELNSQLDENLKIDFSSIKIEKKISEGGYGIIYRGRWRDCVVAIKMLKYTKKLSQIKDFMSECLAMQALRHPNIVLFIGACTEMPNLGIVLEYCKLGSLWNVL